MGKIALLVPREEMLHQAHNILQEKKFSIGRMKVVDTEHTVTEARQAIGDGASIIIARGLQASLIKQYTDIPVVEITLTAQEMALLVMRAKQILKKRTPIIAVVGFKNMFCDMSFFDELYGIELRTYYAKQGAELPDAARAAVEDGADLVVGGDTAVKVATKAGIPSLFLSMTEDSLRQAFSMAESMDYAMGVEKKTAAQMETLLDYSFNGVIRLDASGVVTAVNPMMEDILGRREEDLKGGGIRRIVPAIGEAALAQVLEGGKDYSMFLDLNGTPLFAVLAPVLVENRADGAIITCHKMRKKAAAAELSGRGTAGYGGGGRDGALGLPPLTRFEDICQRSDAMQECVRQASLYAMSDRPVILRGEPGTEKRMLAESIHNGGSRRKGPFLDVSCQGLSGEEQYGMIFGTRGAVMRARGGTLFIRDVEALTPANQHRLYQMIRFKSCGGHGGDIAGPQPVDVRVIAAAQRPLWQAAAEGSLGQELYYLLSGLELAVPPLRERREDLWQKLDDAVRECCERFARYHVLTAGAKKLLEAYPWPGNVLQVESFCERLILTASRRSIDEITVGNLLGELYPEAMEARDAAGPGDGRQNLQGLQERQGLQDRPGLQNRPGWQDRQEPAVDIRMPGACVPAEAARIADALRQCGKNREKTAAALGISKATLWRKMKKYGIETN